jgi:S-adenosyl-L-methionine hydrolase (adenosine-forming)
VSSSRIYLATDYGLDDEFVGVLHAVLARLAPDTQVIDLSHGITPFDVAGGAALLERAAPHLGDGVLVAIVDPGVGTLRRAIAIEVGGEGPSVLVGPDNGLLLGVAARLGGPVRAVDLARLEHAGTFDGRDVFAPSAAAIARGAPLSSLGTEIAVATLATLRVPETLRRTLADGRTLLATTVRWIDRFGNVQLALDADVLSGVGSAFLVDGDQDVPLHIARAFGELEGGELGVLRDANGAVAIVLREGSAAHALHVAVGDRVELALGVGRVL